MSKSATHNNLLSLASLLVHISPSRARTDKEMVAICRSGCRREVRLEGNEDAFTDGRKARRGIVASRFESESHRGIFVELLYGI
jgi:hypothetical protein